jgi:RHS repeat-associated protein
VNHLITTCRSASLSGVIKSMVYSNGLNDFNSFTGDGEIDVLGTYNGAASVINRAHTRTDNQNLTNIFDNVTAANNAAFWMEPAGKLQNADGPWGQKTFYYDGVGNRSTEISTVGGVSTTDVYGYPANSNRLVQITRGTATVASMTYDAGGNLLNDNRLSGGKTYTYNKRNRLATAMVGALNFTYTYNGREQLAIRQQTTATNSAAPTHFVHDIFGNVIAETSGTAAGTFREYIWLPETEIAPTREAVSQVDRPLAVVNGVGTTGVAVWNVSVDHLNRPVLMTNNLKVAMWTAVWQPWGGAHSITGTATLDTRFPGQWYQSETGLHYNWHRSYDPTVGRYTQPDPLGFVDGPSVYGYAGGMPQQLVDPNGQNIIKGGGILAEKAWQLCMRNPKCAAAMSKVKDYCPTCKLERHAAHHYFPGLGFCQHYQLICSVKGVRGAGGTFYWPIPGKCGPNKSDNPPDLPMASE